MKKSKKDRGLIDSFVFREAKSKVDEVLKYEKERTTNKNKEVKIIGLPVHIKRTSKEQQSSAKRTPREQEHNRNNIRTTSVYLTDKRLQVYEWFLKNGISGIYNKSQIVQSLGMPYMTVRKAIWEFEKISLIISEYNKSIKKFEYTISDKVLIKNWAGNTKGTTLEQQKNNIDTSLCSSSNITTTTNKNIAFFKKIQLDNYFSEIECFPKNFDKLSLVPLLNYLQDVKKIEREEELIDLIQTQIDISISQQNQGKVKSAQGLLFSKILKPEKGLLNPTKDFISRKVFFEKKILEEKKKELEELKKIKAEREEVELELYEAKLTKEEYKKFEEEAEKQYKPNQFSKKEIEIPMIIKNLIKEQFQKQKDI